MPKTFKQQFNEYANLFDSVVSNTKNYAQSLPNKNDVLDRLLESL